MLVYDKISRHYGHLNLCEVVTHGHSSSLIEVIHPIHGLSNVSLSFGVYLNSTIETYLLINMSIVRHSGPLY